MILEFFTEDFVDCTVRPKVQHHQWWFISRDFNPLEISDGYQNKFLPTVILVQHFWNNLTANLIRPGFPLISTSLWTCSNYSLSCWHVTSSHCTKAVFQVLIGKLLAINSIVHHPSQFLFLILISQTLQKALFLTCLITIIYFITQSNLTFFS